MNPLRLVSLPADVVTALRSVPLLVERLDAVTEATAELAPMRRSVERLSRDARVLPEVREATDVLARMEAIELGSLNRLDDNLGALSASVKPLGRIAERVPGSAKRA